MTEHLLSLAIMVAVGLVGGCTTSLEESETSAALRSRAALSAQESPTMTEEGCLLTPGCWNGPSMLGRIHNDDVSYSIGASPLPDPTPQAPGIWLGFRSVDCYLAPPFNTNSAGHIDNDEDALDDDCEYKLANAFAPMLAVDANENCLGGEPYWAAKYIDNLPPYQTGDMVKILYMPGYYRDCGNMPHNGDSEFIQLTIAYNPSTQHWELINSWLSAHQCVDDSWYCISIENLAESQSWGRDLQWPSGRPYSYPRVWISQNKHANYRDKQSCNNGGAIFFTDTCVSGRDVGRFIVWESHNVGSGDQPLLDCVDSQQAAAPYWGEECFWTSRNFRGWWQTGDGVTPYAVILRSIVFQATRLDATRWWSGSFGS